MMRGSLKECGTVLIISAFLDRGLTTFSVILGFKDDWGDGLRAIRSYRTGDSPINVLWIKHLFRFFSG